MFGQTKVDEFAFILLGAIIFIAILMVTWTTPTELPPKVFPTSFTLHARPNQTYKLTLNISGKITHVHLEANGTIAGWISFSKNNFDIPSDYSLVGLLLTIPNVSRGKYSGYITVHSTGGQAAIPIQVYVEEKIKLSSRTIPLKDFSISNFGGKKILDSKESVEVSTSYFSKKKIKLVGIIDASMKAKIAKAYVDLIIDEKNNFGDLIIKLNDKEIYRKKAPLGEVIIPINTSELSSANIVSIEASNPGWYFWSATKYHIALAKFIVEFKQTEKSFSFSLQEPEIQNFHSFTLSSLLSVSSPVPTLKIKVNNQVVYLDKPPLTALNITFNKDLFGRSLLLRKNNTISFSLESKGSISFSNVLLSINSFA